MAAPIVLSAPPCGKCLSCGFLLTCHVCSACGFDADKHSGCKFEISMETDRRQWTEEFGNASYVADRPVEDEGYDVKDITIELLAQSKLQVRLLPSFLCDGRPGHTERVRVCRNAIAIHLVNSTVVTTPNAFCVAAPRCRARFCQIQKKKKKKKKNTAAFLV